MTTTSQIDDDIHRYGKRQQPLEIISNGYFLKEKNIYQIDFDLLSF